MKSIFDTVSKDCSKIVTKTYSTSFSMATKMLANSIRQDIYNIYGFVRLADEIVDSFHEYPKKDLFIKFEADLEVALKNKISLKRNTFGSSVIEVEVEDQFGRDELPQIWDDLRDRVADAQQGLPAGALPSIVNDDFGDVFGILYAVSAPGFSDAEIWDIATFMRRDLLTVEFLGFLEIKVPSFSGSKVFLIRIGIFFLKAGCMVGGYKTFAPK